MTANKAQNNPSVFIALDQQKYILLKTFRKSGVAVATPVWFAQEGDRLYVTTTTITGKVKRINSNGKVLLAPCDRQGKVLGAEIAGVARVLPVSDHPRVNAVLAQKFGFLYQVLMFMGNIRKSVRTFIEIVPEK